MKDEALKLALEALETCDGGTSWADPYQIFDPKLVEKAITAIKQALAAPTVQDEAWKAKQKACADEATKCAMEALTNPEHPATKAAREYYGVQPAPVQVSPLEFVTMVMEKEHLVGKPLFWAEWPNKENT